MTSQTIYREHLSEPWFTLVSLGLKTCEGRLHKNRFREFMEGDIIQWVNDDFGKERCCFTKITYVKVYGTFEEYLNDRGLENCLPGMPNLEHGLGVYFKYFRKEYEEKYGVVSFELEKVNFAVTCIFNGVPCGTNYVKSIDEAYKLLIEYNENHELEWEIDNSHINFNKNGSLYMLKGQFCDIDFILDDLNVPHDSILEALGNFKKFKNIQTIRDKKKEEEEYAKYCAEIDKAREEYLASGKTMLLCSSGRL